MRAVVCRHIIDRRGDIVANWQERNRFGVDSVVRFQARTQRVLLKLKIFSHTQAFLVSVLRNLAVCFVGDPLPILAAEIVIGDVRAEQRALRQIDIDLRWYAGVICLENDVPQMVINRCMWKV